MQPPLSRSRRLSRELLGISPTTRGSSRSVSAPDTADTAEKDVILDSLSDLSAERWLRLWLDDTLSAAVTALRMLAELGVVLLLEMDWGRSSAFLRRRTECFRDTWRLGGVDVAKCWSWSIVRDDRDRLKADKTLKAVGG